MSSSKYSYWHAYISQSTVGHVARWCPSHVQKWWPMLSDIMEKLSLSVTCATYHDFVLGWLGIHPCARVEGSWYIFKNMVALAARMSASQNDGFPSCLVGNHPSFPTHLDLSAGTFVGYLCEYDKRCYDQCGASSPPWLIGKGLRNGHYKVSNLQCIPAIVDQNGTTLNENEVKGKCNWKRSHALWHCEMTNFVRSC